MRFTLPADAQQSKSPPSVETAKLTARALVQATRLRRTLSELGIEEPGLPDLIARLTDVLLRYAEERH